MKLRFRKDRNEVIKLNSDYYNTKLQKLIEEASKDGITLHDNKFEQTEDEKFPVMEVFFVNNSTYEDSGRYHIYKRTVKISQDDYGRIVAYAKENNYKKLIAQMVMTVLKTFSITMMNLVWTFQV